MLILNTELYTIWKMVIEKIKKKQLEKIAEHQDEIEIASRKLIFVSL